MKKLFFWRLNPSEKDFIDLWENAFFVFDTNFLLDLYRVSQSTAKDFLNILEHLKERIWLPYQVASEFLDRREEIINSEAASFEKALTEIKKWKEEQLNFNRLKGKLGEAGRVISSEVAILFEQQDDYKAVVEEVEKSFKDKIEEIAKTQSLLNPEEDYILEKLLTLFDSKVGEPFDIATSQKLYREGEERYKQKKPPGFMDDKDKGDERKYGDFILWKQTLDFAKKKSCSIVLVTGEKKEDWWTKKGGQIVSPHFELRREFQEQVNQHFWMYQTQRFLELAREKLDIEISPRSIEEANVVAEAEAVKENCYEKFSEVIRQVEANKINEDLLKELGASLTSEDFRKRLRTPIITEDLLKEVGVSLSTSIISENLLKEVGAALSTSLISENLLKELGASLISEDWLKELGASLISEDFYKRLRTPIVGKDFLKPFRRFRSTEISEDGLKASTEAHNSTPDNPKLTLKGEENSSVSEDINFDLSTEIPDELISEQHSNQGEDSASNSNSRDNQSEEKSRNTKPESKRRSSQKKSKKDANSEK